MRYVGISEKVVWEKKSRNFFEIVGFLIEFYLFYVYVIQYLFLGDVNYGVEIFNPKIESEVNFFIDIISIVFS